MATKAEKIALIQKFAPPVELTGKETVTELDEIISKKNNVEPAPLDKGLEASEKPKKKAKESVTFKLRGHRLTERTFSQEVHGDNFNEIADEFHTTNADKITHRIHDGGGDSSSDE